MLRHKVWQVYASSSPTHNISTTHRQLCRFNGGVTRAEWLYGAASALRRTGASGSSTPEGACSTSAAVVALPDGFNCLSSFRSQTALASFTKSLVCCCVLVFTTVFTQVLMQHFIPKSVCILLAGSGGWPSGCTHSQGRSWLVICTPDRAGLC